MGEHFLCSLNLSISNQPDIAFALAWIKGRERAAGSVHQDGWLREERRKKSSWDGEYSVGKMANDIVITIDGIDGD